MIIADADEFLKGVKIDPFRQMIRWKPSKLRENIFNVLASLVYSMKIKKFYGPYNLSEEGKEWCIIYTDYKIKKPFKVVNFSSLKESNSTVKKKVERIYQNLDLLSSSNFKVDRSEYAVIVSRKEDLRLVMYHVESTLFVVKRQLLEEVNKAMIDLISK